MPFAPIENGELYYEEFGKGPPLFLIAGLGGVGSYWRPQIEAFSSEYRVITHDHRGTGKSTRSEITYSVEQMTRDVMALMDHLGIKSADFIGHSTGGAINQTMAVLAPERVKSIVVYASWVKVDEFMARVMRTRKALVLSAGVDAYIELSPALLYPNWWVNNNPDKLAELDRATKAIFPGPSIAASRCQAVIDFDCEANLGKIDRPTCVICARDDFLTPLYCSEQLVEKISDAKLIVLENGGHAVSQVDPQAFNSAVLGYLRSVSSPT